MARYSKASRDCIARDGVLVDCLLEETLLRDERDVRQQKERRRSFQV